MKVPLSSITLGEAEREAVREAMATGELSSAAPAISAFERAMAEATGRAFAVATNSGTSALELALLAMGVGPGDEVIVPALTFAAPALAARRIGARPVFADIDDSWTLDPQDAGRRITPRTKAIIAVDLLGHPCDHDALAALGVPILEDAAEAFGARYRGRPAGGFGAAAIFSFHANKVVSGGEGGCVVCDDPELADRMRCLNAFGMDPLQRYRHVEVGCNFRMTGLVAALIRAQLGRAEELMAGRRAAAARYDAAFAGRDFQRRPVADWAEESVWLYTLASDRREAVLERCRAHGVDARAIWPALPGNPAFRDLDGPACPRAEAVAARAFWLPTFADITPAQCDLVIDAVLGAACRAA